MLTKRQEAHRREKARIKARLLEEPDSEWSINYRAKRRAYQVRWIERNSEAKKRHGKKYYDAHRSELVLKSGAWKKAKKVAAGWIPRKRKSDEERTEYKKQWGVKNRAKNNARLRAKRASNPSFKVACNLRKRLSHLIRLSSATKTAQTLILLGCSLESFRLYLESRFESGMTWENYGQWHIDHIMPCAIFDLTNTEHQRRCFHFSNMQPLWAIDNWRKSDRVTDEDAKTLTNQDADSLHDLS